MVHLLHLTSVFLPAITTGKHTDVGLYTAGAPYAATSPAALECELLQPNSRTYWMTLML